MIGPQIPLSDPGLSLVYQNSLSLIRTLKTLQSHDGLLDEIAEEVHSLHHNLQSHDGLLDENSEEVNNLQSPCEKNVLLTGIKTLSP